MGNLTKTLFPGSFLTALGRSTVKVKTPFPPNPSFSVTNDSLSGIPLGLKLVRFGLNNEVDELVKNSIRGRKLKKKRRRSRKLWENQGL